MKFMGRKNITNIISDNFYYIQGQLNRNLLSYNLYVIEYRVCNLFGCNYTVRWLGQKKFILITHICNKYRNYLLTINETHKL